MENSTAINYVSFDGLNLYARDYSANQPSKETAQKVILCLPGLTRNSLDYQSFGELFKDHYRVIGVDFRGRGNSEYDPKEENYQPVVYARDVIELIDYLNLTEVTLVGTSLGGLVSMLVANIIPDVIQAIVINDIGPEISPVGLARIRGYVGKTPCVESWEEAVEQTRKINELELPDLTDQQWLTFTRGLYKIQSCGKIELAYDPKISKSIASSSDETSLINLWPQFDAIKDKPLLVIRGEFSDILDSICVNKMKTIHPKLCYCEVKNRGHAPLLNEIESVSAIKKFFDMPLAINDMKSYHKV